MNDTKLSHKKNDTLFQFDSFGISDIGLLRNKNEDAFIAQKDYHFYALADGMGGHKAGEIASKETLVYLCSCIKKMFQNESNLETQNISKKLVSYIKNSNTRIYQLGKENIDFRGMGTTLCLTLFHEKFLIHGHVGDSRIYRFRNGCLEKITYDHTLLNQLIETGKLQAYRKQGKRYKNVLTKAIGVFKTVQPDIGISRVFPGDIYLMCSDGLTDFVTDEEISSILSTQKDLKLATKLLIDMAKQKKSNDNITAFLVRTGKKHGILRQQRHNTDS